MINWLKKIFFFCFKKEKMNSDHASKKDKKHENDEKANEPIDEIYPLF